MATLATGNIKPSLSSGLSRGDPSYNPLRRCFSLSKSYLKLPSRIRARLFAATVRASSAIAVENNHEPVIDEMKWNIRKNILACPICYEQVIWNGDPDLSLRINDLAWEIAKINVHFRNKFAGNLQLCLLYGAARAGNPILARIHILTINGGGNAYGEPMPASTEIFSWRQSFSLWGGFPGPEKEFELIKDHIKPILGGNIIDASCGSGMLSRLFAKSGLFSLVVALDFSESMLQQCYEFIKQEDNFPEEHVPPTRMFQILILVRADISRLPFASSTVDAIHASAALHCWPSPLTAVAEVSCVLRPGGMVIATTYIVDGVLSYIPPGTPLRQSIAKVLGSNVFLSQTELIDLMHQK